MLSQKSGGCGILMKALAGVAAIREGLLEEVSLKWNPKGQTGVCQAEGTEWARVQRQDTAGSENSRYGYSTKWELEV